MSLISRLDTELTEALKDKNEVKKIVLRSLKGALKNASIEKNQAELTDEEELQVVAREIKRRKEAIIAYESAKKPDLKAAEEAELEILTAYLPAQMSEEEIRNVVTQIISAGQFNSAMVGQVMGQVSQQLKGKADMSTVSNIVREELAKLG